MVAAGVAGGEAAACCAAHGAQARAPFTRGRVACGSSGRKVAAARPCSSAAARQKSRQRLSNAARRRKRRSLFMISICYYRYKEGRNSQQKKCRERAKEEVLQMKGEVIRETCCHLHFLHSFTHWFPCLSCCKKTEGCYNHMARSFPFFFLQAPGK